MSLAPPPAVIVAILGAWPGVEVQQGLEAELLHPAQGPPEVVEGAQLALLLQVGGGEWLARLDVPVPVAWGPERPDIISQH